MQKCEANIRMNSITASNKKEGVDRAGSCMEPVYGRDINLLIAIVRLLLLACYYYY